jgi:ATP-dependent Lon protease
VSDNEKDRKTPAPPAAEESTPDRPSTPESAAEETHTLPNSLPVLPIRDNVVFPVMVLPMQIGEEDGMRLIDDVVLKDKLFVAVACREEIQSLPVQPDELYQVGTACVVLQMLKLPDGGARVLFQGICRTRVEQCTQTEPYIVADVQHLEESETEDLETSALFKSVNQQFLHMLGLMPNVSDEVKVAVMNISSPGRLADMIATNLNITTAEKQEILEELDVKARLQKVNRLLSRETELVELAQKIQTQAKSQIDKGQREYYLRQQLKAIQEELGEADPHVEEVKELRQQVEELKLPDEVRKEADRELDRLERMNPASAEYTVSRTYLDWVIALPWSKSTTDNLDLKEARKVLEEDHYGLEKIKERVLEFLAVRKLRQDMRGSILCFVGPPGTGKTSIGKSIARAMGRNYVRISLGGVRDEAEIRGHRRTYIGALPGRIITGLRKAGSNNPVFMLDEIDKLGADFRGDPASALLEVLDPEQNHTFTDHYLDVPFDLTHVFFITTANILDPVPPALRDRMEVLEFPGYTAEEKLQIAKRFLVPHQVDAHGLKSAQLRIRDAALRRMIREYTREAGVRNLEREIASLARKAAKRIAVDERESVNVAGKDVPELLGPPRFTPEVAERTSEPGVATGLAWTSVGGDIIFVESTRTPGSGKLILTGRLGDVMKESAQAALTHVRARAEELKIKPEAFERTDFHIHVPAGAIPKDGPSAGVTIAMSLVSLLTQKPVNSHVAMTGEITLRGRVMPVGGIKEKVLAAKRAGIRTVILPKDNSKDLTDVPDYAKEKLDFVLVETVEDMLPAVFDGVPRKRRATRGRKKKSARRGKRKRATTRK